MKLGVQVGLGPGQIVLDGHPVLPPKGAPPHPIFDPYLLRPNGCMDQDATWYGARPQPRQLCVRWGSRSTLPKKEAEPPPQFSAHFYCGQTAACIAMPLGMYVGLSRGDFVLDGDLAPLHFRPMFIIVILISLKTLHNAQSLLVCSSSSFSILCILFLEKKV